MIEEDNIQMNPILKISFLLYHIQYTLDIKKKRFIYN